MKLWKGNEIAMAVDTAPTKKMRFKLRIVAGGVLFLFFFVLVLRIFYISIFATYEGETYGARARSQLLRSVTIDANRGTMYDRNMNILAKSATVWKVFVSPKDIKDEDKERVAQGLADILGLNKDEVLEKCNKSNYYEEVKTKIEQEDHDKILALAKEQKLDGIHLVKDTKRYYPYDNLASSVIGFVGSDNQGLAGLEAKYDDVLSGTPGRIVSAKNGVGTDLPFKYEKEIQPENGNSLLLTIDREIQGILEKAVSNAVNTYRAANRGCGIVMDVNTGEILAMTTQPDFNLNDPFTLIDQSTMDMINAITDEGERTKQLSDARQFQWRNKAVSDTYYPGSVYKVVTGSSALEENTVALSNTFDCSGTTTVGPQKFHCWRRAGHGHLDLTGAFVNSCNPAFIKIGLGLGGEKFYEYEKAFGFFEKTGIDLPGEGDNIMAPLDGPFGLKNSDITLASCSFGQTNGVTPIQMITAFAATINGGYVVTPHLVKQVLDDNKNTVETVDAKLKRQVLSEETSVIMRDVLEQAVSANGGSNAYVKGYRIGAKTGTSQIMGTSTASSEGKHISSCCAFAPADDPKIAVLIIVDTPTTGEIYGSVVASPAVATVMREALPLLGVQPQYTQEELQEKEAAVPSVVGKDTAKAKTEINSAGLQAEVVGEGTKVVKQVPSGGISINKGGKVWLYTENEIEQKTVAVPDLSNLSPSEANKRLATAGLNIQISGGAAGQEGAKVTEQSFAAGTMVPKGTVVAVQCVTGTDAIF